MTDLIFDADIFRDFNPPLILSKIVIDIRGERRQPNFKELL